MTVAMSPTTATRRRPGPASAGREPAGRRRPRSWSVWLALWPSCRGQQTRSPCAAADLTALHRWLNDVNDSVGANRNSNPLFLYFFNEIRAGHRRTSSPSSRT